MPAGTGTVGRQVQLRVNGVLVPGVREKSAAFNGEPIDVSSDDSSGWRELLSVPGEQSVEISISGVTKSNTLKTMAIAGSGRVAPVTLTYPDGGILAGDFYLHPYSEGMPYKEAVTFEGTLGSSGQVTYTPGP